MRRYEFPFGAPFWTQSQLRTLTSPVIQSISAQLVSTLSHMGSTDEGWAERGQREEPGTHLHLLHCGLLFSHQALVKQPNWQADFSSLASSSTGVTGDSTVPTAVSEKEKEPGQRALQTTCWFINLWVRENLPHGGSFIPELWSQCRV